MPSTTTKAKRKPSSGNSRLSPKAANSEQQAQRTAGNKRRERAGKKKGTDLRMWWPMTEAQEHSALWRTQGINIRTWKARKQNNTNRTALNCPSFGVLHIRSSSLPPGGHQHRIPEHLNEQTKQQSQKASLCCPV